MSPLCASAFHGGRVPSVRLRGLCDAAKAFLAHIRDPRSRGIHASSAGAAVTEPVRCALRQLPDQVRALQHLEARRRAPARVEDCIRCGGTTGLDRLPLRHFHVGQAWLEQSLAALDPAAQTRLLPEGQRAAAEPKKRRYRPLLATARFTRSDRRTHLRIAAIRPRPDVLTSEFDRLAARPRPAT